MIAPPIRSFLNLVAGCLCLAACSGPASVQAPEPAPLKAVPKVAEPVPSAGAVVFFLSVKNPKEPEAYQQYSAGSGRLLAEAGAVSIGKFGVQQALVGDCQGALFGYAEGSDEATLAAVFESEAYRALIPAREKAFTSLNVYIGRPNSLGPNNLEPKKASFLALAGKGGAAAGSPAGDPLASFSITQHLVGGCDAQILTLWQADENAAWAKGSIPGGQALSVFSLAP